MRKIKILSIILFLMVLVIPIIKFNWQENAVSAIDNRKLTNNPFGKNYVPESEGESLAVGVNNYINDRLGYREQMIKAYTIANDWLFNEMVHPSYEYGKDGYVFGKDVSHSEFSEYHIAFADMVKEIQNYCESRDVPFVFVFNPSKTSVLENKLKDGINYDNDWVDDFFEALNEREVVYIDNTELMKQKIKDGEMVFNKQYDAGHWNDTGAFYGVNQILNILKVEHLDLHINSMDEFTIQKTLNISLPASEFPIHEYEWVFKPKQELSTERTDEYVDELKIDKEHPYFCYSINEHVDNSYKGLVFQGSYMNGKGTKFLQNALHEYIAVHDYQNVLNFSYYYNIFKPDFVVFEVAEYTFMDDYFSFEGMKQMELNPELKQFDLLETQTADLNPDGFFVEQGDQLSKITVEPPEENIQYMYLQIGDEIFDLVKSSEENLYEVTIENDRLNAELPKKVMAIMDSVKKEYLIK